MPDPTTTTTTADPAAQLRAAIVRAIRAAFPQLEGEVDPLIAPAKQAALGDFQCNAAMGLGKKLGKPPRDVALAIVQHADLGTLAEALTPQSVAGPGFINIRLRGEALGALLEAMDNPSLGVPAPARRETVVVDLMGVNLAKQMHVGHLRSPIVGDALARTFERLGHRVIRQNHVGDWGLPIAMVTARLMRLRDEGKLDLARLTLDDLDKAYREAQLECQRDLSGQARAHESRHPKAIAELDAQVEGATHAFTKARQTLVDLQRKEPATYEVWKTIEAVTMRVCLDVCAMLGVKVVAADSAGESSYADELAPMLEDLLARSIAEPDQGALIVRLDAPPLDASGNPLWEPIKEPALVRKSDGGYLYATTDIAAVRRRVRTLGADRVVYAVDARQQLHLRQVFAASIKAGYADRAGGMGPALLQHAFFGSVLGEDGRPFKTRSGENVKLADLIRETFDRAKAALTARSQDLSGSEAEAVARGVGIAALKYADLSTDRVKDYVFSFDRMLAFEGDTGPYLLYALVRVRSILRKARERGVTESYRAAPLRPLSDPAEKALALTLLRYPQALESCAANLEPHRVCQFLLELAGNFASFFDRCPVLATEDAALRDARLRLCDLTGRVLEDALGVLGIPGVERM